MSDFRSGDIPERWPKQGCRCAGILDFEMAGSSLTGRLRARELIEEVLAGRPLPLDEFHRRWPDDGDPLIRVVFEETEDTLEHAPRSWVRPGDADERFRRFRDSAPYKILQVDHLLLADDFAHVPSQSLLDIRARILAEVDLDHGEPVVASRELLAKELGRD